MHHTCESKAQRIRFARRVRMRAGSGDALDHSGNGSVQGAFADARTPVERGNAASAFEGAIMTAANQGYMVALERGAVRHALARERIRAGRFRQALASARDGKRRGRCRRKLDAALGRAATLALALVDMGEEVPMAQVCTEFDGRLLDAMDLVLRKQARPGLASRTCARAAGTRRSATGRRVT